MAKNARAAREPRPGRPAAPRDDPPAATIPAAPAPVPLDATDRRLLRHLQRDGRASVVALAEAVGLSPTPLARRIKRLEKAGAIARYAAVVDPARVGLPVRAFVMVALSTHDEATVEAFHAALARRPEVLAAHAMSGEMDYLLEVVAADLDAYGDFALRALLRMPGVKDTRSSFVLGTLKGSGEVPV